MKVVIFGGSGFIGRNLSEELISSGYEVIIITRPGKHEEEQSGLRTIEWDYRSPLPLNEKIDAVINLSGKSIGQRWTDKAREQIILSRVITTSAIVTAINSGLLNPEVFINSSAVGYYGERGDEPLDENESPGKDFLSEVCIKWEAEAYRVNNNTTRVITLRTGVVFGKEGVLKKLVLPYKFYSGGTLGPGHQWLSWIHIRDLARLVKYIIENKEIRGPVNAVSPSPVTMKDLGKTIGKVLGSPSWFHVPGFLLKTALGGMSDMLLHGQRAIPEKLMQSGFKFMFPDPGNALEDILSPSNP
jgi:uncharacterized protein (TIGR01777 family)